MEKRIVVTIACGKHFKTIGKISHPLMLEYAKKCNAEFRVWESSEGHSSPHYQKLEIGELLKYYDRVLYLDTDIIIREDAPDLFELVPMEYFAAFNEFFYTNHPISAMSALDPDPEWIGKNRYFNTGVMLCSKKHAPIFELPKEEVMNFYEQTYLNHRIHKLGVETFELNYNFNRMSCMDKITGSQRFESFFIHYAGFPNRESLPFQMKMDLAEWRKNAPFHKYKKNLYFKTGGGLGDVICAEPVIRFMLAKFYRDENVVIETDFPEVFDHLPVRIIKKGERIEDIGYRVFDCMPKTIGPMEFNICHPTDFAAIQVFRGQLSPLQKRIFLSSAGHNIPREIEDILRKSILIHAGKGWASKTFPTEWWEEIVSLIRKEDINVVLIGKDLNPNQGVLKLNTDATDLTNELSMKSLFRAIELAPVLITNDSAPTHIAGAYENAIGLIESCKPDYRILPFRHGVQYWMAQGLSGKFIDRGYDPTKTDDVMMNEATEEEIKAILPQPKFVADWAMAHFNAKLEKCK